MTIKEALNIIITYNYFRGAEEEIGNKCINLKYLEAKKNYEEALAIICKLGNLEEELGIDLITLFKILKNGIYVKEKFYASSNICYTTPDLSYLEGKGFYLGLKRLADCLIDYSKTWAFTKEELENDKEN